MKIRVDHRNVRKPDVFLSDRLGRNELFYHNLFVLLQRLPSQNKEQPNKELSQSRELFVWLWAVSVNAIPINLYKNRW